MSCHGETDQFVQVFSSTSESEISEIPATETETQSATR